jgi:hypothetical protein
MHRAACEGAPICHGYLPFEGDAILSIILEPVINFVPLHAMGWGYVWYAMTMESWGIVVGVAIRVM